MELLPWLEVKARNPKIILKTLKEFTWIPFLKERKKLKAVFYFVLKDLKKEKCSIKCSYGIDFPSLSHFHHK